MKTVKEKKKKRKKRKKSKETKKKGEVGAGGERGRRRHEARAGSGSDGRGDKGMPQLAEAACRKPRGFRGAAPHGWLRRCCGVELANHLHVVEEGAEEAARGHHG